MIELPEAAALVEQLNKATAHVRITSVVAGQTPHKLAWLSGDSAYYNAHLSDRRIEKAVPNGGVVELRVEGGNCLWISDGINLRLIEADKERPQKHQLLVELEDGRALCAWAAMYGGIHCAPESEMDNPYIIGGRDKPSPLSDLFDRSYFQSLLAGNEKLNAKAFLATEQRIPGLGNGSLQDILFCAQLHPKRKMNELTEAQLDTLFNCICSVLREMASSRGRDTETDLYGNAGGYATRMSRNTVGKPCKVCSETIVKMPFMGGSVYVCPSCQPG